MKTRVSLKYFANNCSQRLGSLIHIKGIIFNSPKPWIRYMIDDVPNCVHYSGCSFLVLCVLALHALMLLFGPFIVPTPLHKGGFLFKIDGNEGGNYGL